MMEYLPLDISLSILSRLPLVSLFRCRLVCKSWSALVQHPSLLVLHTACHDSHNNPLSIIFFSNYLNHFEYVLVHDVKHGLKITNKRIDLPFKSKINVPVNDVLSCNGLLLLSTCNIIPPPSNLLLRFIHCRLYSLSYHYSRREQIFVCNPLTGEFKSLLDRFLPGYHYSVYGFGYHPRYEEYKVVKISNSYKDNDQHIEVCTLGTNKWRVKKRPPYYLCGSTKVSVNGALYWVGKVSRPREEEEGVVHAIVAFDLFDENFCEVPSPDCRLDFERDSNLLVLGGSLCILNNVNKADMEIWAMKDHGVEKKWTKEYVIVPPDRNFGREFQPLCVMRNGWILFQNDTDELVCYNSESKRFTNIYRIQGRFSMVTHVRSLVWRR